MAQSAILFEYKKIDESLPDDDPANHIDGENWGRVQVGVVKFHQFGINFEPREFGIATFSTAIVEMPDGMLENVPVELVQLIPEDTVFN